MMKAQYAKLLSCIMAAVFPISMFASDSGASGMLYAHGDISLNGSSVSRSSAVFSGDLVQTEMDSVANINATGSTVLIRNSSLVEYEGKAITLEHGAVSVSTSKLLATHVGDVTVSPAKDSWTEFEVRDVNGTVQIVARLGDVTITDDKGTSTLTEGQTTTRDESDSESNKKKKKRQKAGAAPAAKGGIMDSPEAIGIGAGVIAGVAAWALIRTDQPASPTQ